MGCALCGVLVAPAVGYWLRFSHSAYGPVFFVLGFMYLLAFAVLHVLVPKLEPVSV
jgi:hypothetical protein